MPQQGVTPALPLLQHGSLETVNHLFLLGRLPLSRILQANLKAKQKTIKQTFLSAAISAAQPVWSSLDLQIPHESGFRDTDLEQETDIPFYRSYTGLKQDFHSGHPPTPVCTLYPLSLPQVH